MEQKYVINETLNRIEPLEKKCSYCRQKEMSLMDSCFYETLYLEHDRSNYVVFRNVKFNKVSIGVPRCENCKSIHEEAETKAKKYIFIAAGIILFLPMLLSLSFDAFTSGVVPALIVLIAGFLFKNYIVEKIVINTDILSEKDGAAYSVIVQDFLEGGWQYKKPEA